MPRRTSRLVSSRKERSGCQGRPAFELLESRALLATLPVVSIADASVTEGTSGTKTLTFTASLSTAATSAVTVRFATSDGTATTAGGDYTATSGTLSFGPGASRARGSVMVKGDTTVEADETFRITLSSPVGCTLGRSVATGTILNDDAPPPPPPTTGSWTILVYMTGEDLNADAKTDINEMEKALATLPGSVRIVVSWDQPKSSVDTAYATGGGTQAAWRTYGRSVLKADTRTSTIASTFDLSFGERNTGDPATLVDFVKWGVARAPASHYVLQMWGHGNGLDGSQFDSESGDDALTINEIGSALAAAGMPTIDLVSYDNCLMAMAEVGVAVAARTGVYVASEETINGTGQDYTTAYAALKVADPSSVTVTQIAAGMVASFGKQYAGDPTSDTFSAVATSGYATLTAALKSFTTAAVALTSTHRTTLLNAAESTTAFDEPSFRDLADFMTKVAAATSLPLPLRNAATATKSAVTAMTLAKTSDHRGTGGISVFLPTTSSNLYLPTYKSDAAAFCAATGWDVFATWLATGTRSAAPTANAGTKAFGRDAIPVAAFAALANGEAHAVAPRRGAVALRRAV